MNKDNRLSPAGSKIVGALTEFCDALESGARIEERFTVRTVTLDLQPRKFGPEEVKQLRDSLRLSQALFAKLLGVGVKTVRSWEQGLKPPSPMARRFMDEMATSPEHWKDRLKQIIRTKDDRTIIA